MSAESEDLRLSNCRKVAKPPLRPGSQAPGNTEVGAAKRASGVQVRVHLSATLLAHLS